MCVYVLCWRCCCTRHAIVYALPASAQIVVFDEADRCLDMGFEADINEIVSHLPAPPQRQTLLFSATQTRSVRDLARLSLKDPEYLSVHEHAKHATPTRLVRREM